jgi:DnaJ-class molecular chaperone
MNHCPECGSNVSIADKYCSNCGERLSHVGTDVVTLTSVSVSSGSYIYTCGRCGGKGSNWSHDPCHVCGGKGKVRIPGRGKVVTCGRCEGKGSNWSHDPCKSCGGKGRVRV